MGVVDNTPTGKLIRTIMLAFVAFEQDMIVERTKEGKTVVKQKLDFREGHPVKYERIKKEHWSRGLSETMFFRIDMVLQSIYYPIWDLLNMWEIF